jgi:hypothetical protein
LTEDIYLDYFSYAGSEFRTSISQRLPLDLNMQLALEGARRTYVAPAVDLNGVESAPERIDLRGSAEVTLSRYFELGEGLGLDLHLIVTALRNQSNDAYNDFGLASVAAGLGVGW